MSGALGLRAPGSGGPFENLMAGVFLACGFVVDVDLLWTIPGEGDIAQFDFVAFGQGRYEHPAHHRGVQRR